MDSVSQNLKGSESVERLPVYQQAACQGKQAVPFPTTATLCCTYSRTALTVHCFSPCTALHRALLLTVHCSSPCTALHRALLLTVHCSSPCTALHRALLFTVHCSSPCTASHRALLFTVHCSSPCTASHRALLFTVHCSSPCTARHRALLVEAHAHCSFWTLAGHSVVLETDRQTLSFSVLHAEDLEAMVCHMTASLKRVFPDSSPGKLLKTVPADLLQRILTLTDEIEEQLSSRPGSCGGFSGTYAALCDFNEMPCREEIQWDIDNIYHMNNWREFNLQDFSHLDSSKELKLSVDIQQQLTFLLSRSPSLEEVSLEASGLKMDFAFKMAAALREHPSSTLQSINLSGNPLEDKGVIALSQELGSLAAGLRLLSLSRLFSASLTHLDLSANPGSMGNEEATSLFKFLSSTNSLSHLDLSDTSCPLDTLFVSLSAGCCFKLMHLNLARNPFSHRKVREVTRSIGQFFSQSCELKYVGLSATKLPPQALRLLLQGLANNILLLGLGLDISSSGAHVIQEHISEVTAITSLDISDNGFESDMVTLVLSVGRCPSLRHLALGRNFAMKSRPLTDVLHRIAQLIQDEECPLQSLSVSDSKLKAGMHILLSALGGHAALTEVDISGNNIGDTGAKMLAKALLTNTTLRNFTLQQVSGLADITQSYRGNPDRTEEALHKIQRCLDRNNQRQPDRGELQLCKAQPSEMQVQGLCLQLDDSLQRLNPCSPQEVQAEVLTAQEVLHNARESFKLLPTLYEEGRKAAPDGGLVNCILTDAAASLADEINRSIQGLAEGLMRGAEGACPWWCSAPKHSGGEHGADHQQQTARPQTDVECLSG
ncbi:hypothetical protein KUCAC02_021918 [Chaenocephalus aceratus]|uniref:Uncharacterized protein n=1 Tax=Chaenocephalus aceratus TaxID=36190 RepID=A0ACB9XGW0_CHAAC|nr:hypothetical protein KUCAC02_021918 [Chaenocephalus aceratus]